LTPLPKTSAIVRLQPAVASCSREN